MSETIRNGESIDLPIESGEKIAVVAVSGNYTLTVIDGAGKGTVLGTTATGGMYGPYASAVKVRLSASAISEIDFDVAAVPEIISDTYVTAATNPITGGLELLAGGEAIQVGGYYGDLYLDRVVSGLALPASGGLETTISPGVAYVNGARIATTGASVTLSASSDNYVDFTDAGTFVISPVSVAAAAPAMAANSIRLGYVTTNATTVTARVTAALDSLGNWMGNTVQSDACQLRRYNNATLGGAVVSLSFPAGNVMFDNAHMYDNTLPTRITIQRAGLYRVSYACVLANGSIDYVRIRLNGSTDTRFPTLFTPSGWLTPQSSFDVYYNVGDYIECSITPNVTVNPFAYYTFLSAVRIG